jgi:pSer/pThr/pTyr-binding forkhead associated (FHA) protein
MILQVRDLASQKLIAVPEDGLTFGREGGDAQVQVADMGVSKRHAEVFFQDGAWYLKDLGSSNGTMLANERISDATEILPGDIFQLSKRKFEVLKVLEESAAADATAVAPQTETDRKPQTKAAAKADLANPIAPKPSHPPSKKVAGQKLPAAGSSKEATRAAPDAQADDTGNASVGQVLAGVPKAIAYYLVHIPLLLLNPFGTVRKAIDEQPKEPMDRLELIAWALPGTITGAALGFVATVVFQLITKQLNVGGLIVGGLLIPAVAATIGAIVIGLIWHPVLEWLVDKLQGESDGRARTNYFLQVIAATIITQVPSALAIIFGAVSLPFIGVVPLVLGMAAFAINGYVHYRWFEHFDVVKWFRIVMLVLFGLGALAQLSGLPAALRGKPAVAAGIGGAEMDEAQRQALEALKATGTPEEVRQAEEAYRAQRSAVRAAAANAEKMGPEAAKAVAEGLKVSAETAKAAVEDDRTGAEARKDEPRKDEPKKDTGKREDGDAPPSNEVDLSRGSAPTPSYAAWRARYEAIEKRVSDDPTVLKRPNVLKLYDELQELTAQAEAKVRKEFRKSGPKTLGHLRDAELYESSAKTVDELSKALQGR